LELLVTGNAGFDGSRKIYQIEDTRKKLLEHYPKSFFAVFGEKYPELPLEIKGTADSESAAEGGVFGAMWRILKRNRLGADFDQRRIPVLQQTIEVCEMFGLDPYRMESENCTVWLAEDASGLFDAAKNAGISCKAIGFTTKGPAIRRMDGASIAYLRRPEKPADPEKTESENNDTCD